MIYCFLAEGFEETEAIAPVDILRRGGLNIKTVGVGGKIITGSHGISISADIVDTELSFDTVSCVMLPGGMPGTINLENSSIVQNALKHCMDNDLYIGAICAAPSILGHKGYLKGKKATAYPGYEQDLIGAEYVDTLAIADGKIVTGKGAGASIEYGLTLLSVLKDTETSNKVRGSLQCK